MQPEQKIDGKAIMMLAKTGVKRSVRSLWISHRFWSTQIGTRCQRCRGHGWQQVELYGHCSRKTKETIQGPAKPTKWSESKDLQG